MPEFLKSHYDTEGPLGIPMMDAQAVLLDGVLKALPQEDRQVKHLTIEKAPSEVLAGAREDVSWISTEEIDRDKEIVIARGMNESHFKLNPIVTLQHAYYLPPVGKSLWRKRVKDGQLTGIKAKTQYPLRPESWPEEESWTPDEVFALVQAGLMSGKSIGFLSIASHAPTSEEIHKNPALEKVRRIIDEWLLLEYATCFLPMNQASLVEEVSKGRRIPELVVKAGNLQLPTQELKKEQPHQLIAFTAESEIEAAARRQVGNIDYQALAQRAVENALDRARGRV